MIVREYQPSDLHAIEAMHRATVARLFRGQKAQYPLPQLDDAAYKVRLIAQNGSGRPEMAAFVRQTSEVVMMADAAHGTPGQRWELFKALHERGASDAYLAGMDDAHCWLPPAIARSFGKRLVSLGWQRTDWPCFVKRLV